MKNSSENSPPTTTQVRKKNTKNELRRFTKAGSEACAADCARPKTPNTGTRDVNLRSQNYLNKAGIG